MPFEAGNQLWQLREKSGRNRKFDSDQALLDACIDYFKWVDENPLKEERLFHYQGEIKRETISKMRAMSIRALCVAIGIDETTWREYAKEGHDFSTVCKEVEAIVYSQKFEGAAADMLNANIIARDLGLKDSKEIDINDLKDATPWDKVTAGEDE